jgi:hypothetical protein
MLARGLMFVHLKAGLGQPPLAWLGCNEADDPFYTSADDETQENREVFTVYGLRRDVQKRLAEIRTDLDTFADAEAYALMLSGYRMTMAQFTKSIQDFETTDVPTVAWKFLAVERSATGSSDIDETARLLRLLGTARHRTFKVLRYSPALTLGVLIASLGVLAALVGATSEMLVRVVSTIGLDDSSRTLLASVRRPGLALLPTFALIVGLVILLVVGLVILRTHLRANLRLGIRALAATLGVPVAIVAWLHLWTFDRLYRRLGGVSRSPPRPT